LSKRGHPEAQASGTHTCLCKRLCPAHALGPITLWPQQLKRDCHLCEPMRSCTRTHAQLYMRTRALVRAAMRACKCTHKRLLVHSHTCTSMRTHTRTLVHGSTHTHLYMHTWALAHASTHVHRHPGRRKLTPASFHWHSSSCAGCRLGSAGHG